MLSHSKPNLYGAFIRSYAPLGTDVLKLCHAPEHAVFSYEQFFRAAFFIHSSFRKNDDLIEAHIKKLTDDIDNIPEKKDLVALQDQWDSLDKEAAHLGKTDDEKKNEIQSKADVIYAEIERLSAIIKEKEATIQENIQTQKNSLLEIEKELNPEL